MAATAAPIFDVGAGAARAATPTGTVKSVTAVCRSAANGGYRSLDVVARFTGLDRSWRGFVDVTTANMKVPGDGGNYDYSGVHALRNFDTTRKGSATVDGIATPLDHSSARTFKVGRTYFLYASMASNEQPDPVWKTTVVVQPCLRFASAPRPSIVGPVRVGKTVAVKPGTWSPKATLSYRWLLGGTPIPHATKSTFTIPAKDKGKRLSVRVTGKRTDYVTTARTSAVHRIKPRRLS